jgi:hypothetical protein
MEAQVNVKEPGKRSMTPVQELTEECGFQPLWKHERCAATAVLAREERQCVLENGHSGDHEAIVAVTWNEADPEARTPPRRAGQ